VKARARALVRALPAWLALPLLAAIGSAEWWLRPRRRTAGIAHMRHILQGTAREGEVDRLARRYVRQSRGFDERLWRPRASAGARIERARTLDALRAAGQGALVAHVHLYLMAPQVYALAAQGYVDALVFTRDDPPSELQRHYDRTFAAWGVELIEARGGFEQILARLRQGRLCHIALDVPGSSSCVFLDKPAHLASGIAALAFASGAPVVPAVPRRHRSRLRVRIGDPLLASAFDSPAALTRHLAELASAEILAVPDAYHEHDWLAQLWSQAPRSLDGLPDARPASRAQSRA
jgi:lauroyl/myristoyl acyltransferase